MRERERERERERAQLSSICMCTSTYMYMERRHSHERERSCINLKKHMLKNDHFAKFILESVWTGGKHRRERCLIPPQADKMGCDDDVMR